MGMTIQFENIAPVFPVGDIDAAKKHYETLGFTVKKHSKEYAYASRGAVTLHLARVSGIEPLRSNSAAYLFVNDADALLKEWHDAKVDGKVKKAKNTDYGAREGAHIDPDGNLIRIGSPLSE